MFLIMQIQVLAFLLFSIQTKHVILVHAAGNPIPPATTILKTHSPSNYATQFGGFEMSSEHPSQSPTHYATQYVGPKHHSPKSGKFSLVPSMAPSLPSDHPSEAPSSLSLASDEPSLTPSSSPSQFLPATLSDGPSSIPSLVPSTTTTTTSDAPSLVPSINPSDFLTYISSDAPSIVPSFNPSKHLVDAASFSDAPSLLPSSIPSHILQTTTDSSDWPSTNPSSSFHLDSTIPSLVPSSIPSSQTKAETSETPFLSPFLAPPPTIVQPSMEPSIKPPSSDNPKSTKNILLSAIETISLTGITTKMNHRAIEVFETTTKTFLSQHIAPSANNKFSVEQVKVTDQTLEMSRKRQRQLQQTGLAVTFSVTASIPSSLLPTTMDLGKIVSDTFETNRAAYDQSLSNSSSFFTPIVTDHNPTVAVGSSDGKVESKRGSRLNIIAAASVGLLLTGLFAGWFVRRSRSSSSGKSIDIDKSHSDDSSWAPTAISPNSLEAANAPGFGSSDESEATESSLSSYSSGDSSEDFIIKAGNNRYGPNGERSVEEEVENLSKEAQSVITPVSAFAPPAVSLSTCSSISPVSEFSQVKAKVTPSGTKFVQFQVKNDPPAGMAETELATTDVAIVGTAAATRDDQEDARESSKTQKTTFEVIREEPEESETTVPEPETKPKDPTEQPPSTKNEEFNLSSFSSLSAALSCGFRYDDALDLMKSQITETPKQTRLEDCDVQTPRGAFIQHNCTPDGTTFVQLNTDSAQDVGEVLSDLTDMEVKWEGNLDSKTTAVSKTPKTNNLQKFKKAPRKTIYQASTRVEL